MTHLVFIDTETNGLDIERHDIWELALIVEGHANPEQDGEYSWQFRIELESSDAIALSIGKWYERSVQWTRTPYKLASEPAWRTHRPVRDGTSAPIKFPALSGVDQPGAIMHDVVDLTLGAHLVGAVPDFDAYRVQRLLRSFGMLPAWHYHLVDVENLIVGYLRGRRSFAEQFGMKVPEDAPADLSPPWRSSDLSRWVGVDMPNDEDRHTALGDARWAKRIYDKVMGR